LLHGYQDAVFAWSGENPFANLAQSDLYRILPRAEYKNDWIKSTPYGQAFRANNFYDSGDGYVFSRHVPSANQIYAAGVTGYAEFVYSGDPLVGQSIQHLCCISSFADGNTDDTYYGVLTFGMEARSGVGVCPAFRVGNNTALYGFAGGVDDPLVPVTIPVGAKVRQLVTFNPVSKAFASILTFNDVVYERFGTVPNGFASSGSSILIGGYHRFNTRAAYVSGMLEAALWNRAIPPAEMRQLLQRPGVFQPTEFIFPFSFGESSGNDVINTVSEAIVLSPIQAGLRTTEILNASAETLILTPAAASIQTTLAISATPDSLSIAGIPADIHATFGLTSSATFAHSAAVNTQPDALILQPVMAGIYAGEAVVDAAAKAISLSGVQARVLGTATVRSTPAIIGLSGVRSSVRFSESIPAIPATIGLTGVHASVNVSVPVTIPAIPAIIGLAGVAASILMTGVIEIPAKPAIIGLSGVNAAINLSGQIQIPAKAATIALGGVRAYLNGNIRIGSIPAEIQLSGVPFSLAENILARPAAIGLQGVAANIRYYGPIIIASIPAIIGLRGVNARIKIGYEPDMRIEQKIWLALKSRIGTL